MENLLLMQINLDYPISKIASEANEHKLHMAGSFVMAKGCNDYCIVYIEMIKNPYCYKILANFATRYSCTPFNVTIYDKQSLKFVTNGIKYLTKSTPLSILMEGPSPCVYYNFIGGTEQIPSSTLTLFKQVIPINENLLKQAADSTSPGPVPEGYTAYKFLIPVGIQNQLPRSIIAAENLTRVIRK